jgi:hypothetical protein
MWRVAGAAALIAAAGGAAPVDAQTARVAIVAAPGATPVAETADVRSKLMGTGLFQSVAVIDVSNSSGYTPTLAELLQYDAVLTWSNSVYHDAVALGNVLADYVDAGGGVVVAPLANITIVHLEGRWRPAYEIIPAPAANAVTTGAATLGTVVLPGHPIMAGVGTFSGGAASVRPTLTTLTAHGVLVARWSDGKVLAAASSQYPGRADLGFYPPSADFQSGFWLPSTDGARLMANALLSTIHPRACYANCDGSTVAPILNVSDFVCFQNRYAAGDTYANCDGSTVPPVLNVTDFICYLNRYAGGCP